MSANPKYGTNGLGRATVAGLLSALGVVVGAGMPALAADRVPVAPEVPVTAVDLTDSTSNNSPAVAIDPTEARFLAVAARIDLPQFSCTLHVSGVGGRGWQEAEPVPELPPGAERCYAPEVAFDADGTLHYLFVGLRGRANSPMGVFLTTSDDHGDTFSAPRRILGPDSFAVRMAIDPTVGDHGRMHVVWLAAGQPPALGGFQAVANPILAMHSDDGGLTFSDPVQVSDPARTRVVAPALALGADQRVHVAYYDLGEDALVVHGVFAQVVVGPRRRPARARGLLRPGRRRRGLPGPGGTDVGGHLVGGGGHVE